MSTQNKNNVAAELVLAITDAPSFAVVHSRGVDVGSIERLGVGHYGFRTDANIAPDRLHVEANGYGLGKPGNGGDPNAPRHVLVTHDDAPDESDEFELRCFSLDGPPVPDENDCVLRVIIHESPQSAPLAFD